jgi:plastocyanin
MFVPILWGFSKLWIEACDSKRRTIMKKPGSGLILGAFIFLLALTPALGAQWQAKVGANTNDKGRQALAFLPNEIWIHEGDSVTWTFEVDEIHTVTFLTAGQVRPPFPVGCPGFAVGSAMFDGSTCISTPPMVTGQTFTVMFPTVGNFN